YKTGARAGRSVRTIPRQGDGMKSIVLLAAAAAALVATGMAGADGVGSSATGGVHLTVHDVFGLQTLELQHFSFNAKLKDGVADGWYSYRDVEDGAPFDLA